MIVLPFQLPVAVVAVRNLNLQEYQSKQLMNENGITVQNFRIASNVNEAEEISHSLRECTVCFLVHLI